MDTVNLDFINIHDKCYTIPDDKDYPDYYTLYEYCIIRQKHSYIKYYCQSKLKESNKYSIDKYFEYCKQGNVEAVYYCVEEGVNPKMQNENMKIKMHLDMVLRITE